MRLQAQLVPTDGNPLQALALSGDPGGIDLAIPWELNPQLVEGEELDVMLDAQVAALRTEVVVQQLRPEDDALEVRLAYADPDRVRLRMPGAVQEALGWCAERYGRPARLHIRTGSEPWHGETLDLTATAGTVRVPTASAPNVGDWINCRIDLPDNGRQTKVLGQVEQIWEEGSDTRVSLRFTGSKYETQRLNERLQSWLTGRRKRRMQLAS